MGEAEANMEQAHINNINAQSKGRPLLAWIILLPGLLWTLSAIPALLQLFANAAPGHAVRLTPEVADWAVNKTIGSEIRLLTDVNPDIGGLGIRLGFYIPLGLALLTLLAGLHHKQDSAAKEIGSALLITLFYLNFNAVKAAAPGYRLLTFPEVVLVCASLDIVAATLHMTHSAKDTLAARKFIFASALNQFVAYANIIAMLARIRHNYRGLQCIFLVWWGRIDSCTGPSGSVWMYVAIRGLIMLHGMWLDCCHTFSFDSIEKDWAELAPADQGTDGEEATSDYLYASLPGTVFSKWFDWLPSVVVAVSSLESLVDRIRPDASITDWGQSAALVLAISGAVHWLYVVWHLRPKRWSRQVKRKLDFPRYDGEWDPRIICTNDELICASREIDVKRIRRALNHGADKDHVDRKSRKTALLFAVERDNLDLVRELMWKYNADPSVLHTRSALLCAADHGSDKVLRFLIDKNTCLDLKELDDGRDAIWFAARSGKLSTMVLLFEAWKTLLPTDDALRIADERRRAALVVAVERKRQDVIEYLAKQFRDAGLTTSCAKALRTATEWRDKTALESLVTNDSNLETTLALHKAIRDREALDSIAFLANAYHNIADTVDVVDAKGRTPLGVAASLDNAGAVELLLGLGADPFAKRAEDLDNANSPFMLAYNVATSRDSEPNPRRSRRAHRSVVQQWFPNSPWAQFPIFAGTQRKAFSTRNAESSVSVIIQHVVSDAQAFSTQLLALPEDVLKFLFEHEYISCDTLVGSARTPLLVAVLKAPTVTPLKLLLDHHRDWTVPWGFEKALESLTEQGDATSGIIIAGYLDQQLSRLSADDLGNYSMTLGHRDSWEKCGPEVQDVLSKYELVDPSPIPVPEVRKKGHRWGRRQSEHELNERLTEVASRPLSEIFH
ncbi:hypothetical protein BST61_g7873 [Cercospora zeina]